MSAGNSSCGFIVANDRVDFSTLPVLEINGLWEISSAKRLLVFSHINYRFIDKCGGKWISSINFHQKDADSGKS